MYSSSLFDPFFRIFNGNTQVGTSELKQIKMPPLDKIKLIGSKIKVLLDRDKQAIDRIINEILLEKSYVETLDTQTILKELGLPNTK